MFQVNQHVEITSPRLLEVLARRKSKPFGIVVAVDPQAEYPVKVRITDDNGFQIPFTFDGEKCDFTFSFTMDGHHDHRSLSPDLKVVNV
ncbi:hypothetical protein SP069_00025 [Salmonella phage SP069]|uniref:Uncharacterized protein n=2 Tax=Nonanavirus TaxID=1921122 RepID=S4TR30_9CAUD|nr:hypothetical protein QII00_sAgp05 [Salmonella phage SP069]AGF89351.1 hypothetical protein SP062_00355 [Salmonella phage FSL SP-062]AGF89504.1 hypothetical protein SP069_00025 [Salmonella phage SP069]ECL8515697.1 hypothetical protein [Salmonella enterica]